MASGNTRLATWISPGVDERLRLLALLRRQRLSQLITDLLDKALPTAAELAAELQISEPRSGKTAWPQMPEVARNEH